MTRTPLLTSVIAAVLVLDQITKWLVRTIFVLGETRPVLGDIFHLTYYQNTGMAFGMLQGFSDLIAVFSCVAIVFLVYISRRWISESNSPRAMPISLGLVLGGAAGNLIDRIAVEGVVDFLDFGFGDYRWPAFNVADICISTGVGLLVLFSFRSEETKSS